MSDATTDTTPVEDPAPTQEAIDTPADSPIEKLDDEELLRRIQAEMQSRPASEPKRVTISEMFSQCVALVASATGKTNARSYPRVTEQSAVRILELTLMWALNNRSGPSHDILPSESDAEESETPEAPEAPTPNETITASDDQSEPEETK